MKSKILEKTKIDWDQCFAMKFDQSWTNDNRHEVKYKSLKKIFDWLPEDKIKELLRYEMIYQYRRINSTNLLMSYYSFKLDESELESYKTKIRPYFDDKHLNFGVKEENDDFESALTKECEFIIKQELMYNDIIDELKLELTEQELKEKLKLLKEIDPIRHSAIVTNDDYLNNYKKALLFDKVKMYIWMHFQLKVIDQN